MSAGKKWFFPGKKGQPSGPFTTDEVLARMDAGELTESTPCQCEGINDWAPLGQVEPLAAAIATRRAEMIEQARRHFARGNLRKAVEAAATAAKRFDRDEEIAKLLAEYRHRAQHVEQLQARIAALGNENRWCEVSQLVAELREIGVPIEGLEERSRRVGQRLQRIDPLVAAARSAMHEGDRMKAAKHARSALEQVADHLEALEIAGRGHPGTSSLPTGSGSGGGQRTTKSGPGAQSVRGRRRATRFIAMGVLVVFCTAFLGMAAYFELGQRAALDEARQEMADGQYDVALRTLEMQRLDRYHQVLGHYFHGDEVAYLSAAATMQDKASRPEQPGDAAFATATAQLEALLADSPTWRRRAVADLGEMLDLIPRNAPDIGQRSVAIARGVVRLQLRTADEIVDTVVDLILSQRQEDVGRGAPPGIPLPEDPPGGPDARTRPARNPGLAALEEWMRDEPALLPGFVKALKEHLKKGAADRQCWHVEPVLAFIARVDPDNTPRLAEFYLDHLASYCPDAPLGSTVGAEVFPLILEQADRAIKNDNLDEARTLLETAGRYGADDRWRSLQDDLAFRTELKASRDLLAAGNLEPAAKAAGGPLALRPDHPDAVALRDEMLGRFSTLARQQGEAGEYRGAVETLERASKLLFSENAVPEGPLRDDFIALADQQSEAGDYHGAVETLERALTIFPTDTELTRRRDENRDRVLAMSVEEALEQANGLREKGRLEEAERVLVSLREHEEVEAALKPIQDELVNRALAQTKELLPVREYVEARAVIEGVLSRRPDDERANNMRKEIATLDRDPDTTNLSGVWQTPRGRVRLTDDARADKVTVECLPRRGNAEGTTGMGGLTGRESSYGGGFGMGYPGMGAPGYSGMRGAGGMGDVVDRVMLGEPGGTQVELVRGSWRREGNQLVNGRFDAKDKRSRQGIVTISRAVVRKQNLLQVPVRELRPGERKNELVGRGMVDWTKVEEPDSPPPSARLAGAERAQSDGALEREKDDGDDDDDDADRLFFALKRMLFTDPPVFDEQLTAAQREAKIANVNQHLKGGNYEVWLQVRDVTADGTVTSVVLPGRSGMAVNRQSLQPIRLVDRFAVRVREQDATMIARDDFVVMRGTWVIQKEKWSMSRDQLSVASIAEPSERRALMGTSRRLVRPLKVRLRHVKRDASDRGEESPEGGPAFLPLEAVRSDSERY